jgi:hypothetical protein
MWMCRRYSLYELNIDVQRLMQSENVLNHMEQGPSEIDLNLIAPDDDMMKQLCEPLNFDSPASTAAPSTTHTPDKENQHEDSRPNAMPHSPPVRGPLMLDTIDDDASGKEMLAETGTGDREQKDGNQASAMEVSGSTSAETAIMHADAEA